jgi:hypothetical protein
VEKGLHEEAASALRRAVRYRPTEYEIVSELAGVYRQLKQEERIPARANTLVIANTMGFHRRERFETPGTERRVVLIDFRILEKGRFSVL